MKIQYTPVCDSCFQKKPIYPWKDLPAMIGFQMKDGTIINICSSCMIKVGQMSAAERDVFFERIGEKNE